MKPFRYRLRTLLRVAEIDLNSRRRELAAVLQRIEATQAKIDALIGQQAELSEAVTEATKEGVDGATLEPLVSISLSSGERALGLYDRIATLRAEEASARLAVAAATNRVKGLEGHRDRQRQDHRIEEGKLEQKELDEVSAGLLTRARSNRQKDS